MLKKYHNLYVLVLLLLCIDFSSLGLYLQAHPSTGNQSQLGLTVIPTKDQQISSNSVSSSSNIYSSSQQTKPTQSGSQFSPSPTHPTTSSNSGTNNMLSSSGSSIATASSNILGGNYSWAYLSFSFRKLITINPSIVYGGSTLTNFPVLIDLYDADLHKKVQASGNDIIFTDISGNKLSFEIQTFNQNYNSTYAHLVAWVKIPSLSATVDTPIFMYYGNPTIGSQQTPVSVWDSYYTAVYHFETDPSQTIPESTSNQYNAASSGPMTAANLVSGYIGNAYNFVSSSNDKVTSTSTSVYMGVGSAFTFSAWFYEQTTGTRPLISLYSSSSSYTEFYLASGTTPTVQYYYGYYGSQSKTFGYSSISTGHWNYIVITYDGSNLRLYVNGSQVGTAPSATIPRVNGQIQIGYYQGGYNYFNGIIDEPRISNTARSVNSITTEFNNQNKATKSYQISSEDKLVYNLQYREKITIDHTKISGTSSLINYPLLLNFYDTNLHTKVQSSGNDIMFADVNGSKYNHQIDAFYQNYNSTYAHLLVWVQIPNLSSLIDTTFYMYYGNTTIGNLQSPSLVWNNNYQAVWHLGESSGPYADSTGHGYNGTQNGNTQVTGLIDYGQHFSGSNQNIQISSTKNLNPSGNLTLSGWFKLDNNFGPSNQTSQVLFEKYSDSTHDMNIALAGADYYPGNGISVGALIIKIENPNAIYVWTQQTSWTAGVWYYFTIVVYSTNPTSDKIFINGISNTASTLGSPSSADLSFSGSWGIGGGQVDTATISSGYSWFQGALDEFQILGGVQSNYGINTSYNNQLSSKSFFSVGTEQSLYPTVKNFGVFDNGTGHPQFWTNVTIGWTQRSITSATISLNGTAYSMALNGSGLWVFSPALVHFNDYYTYQIISATDSFGNSLFTPTNTQNVRFNLDKVTPTVLTWTYDPTIGINGTFIASVADTWGIINTVIVTVTYCQNCSANHVTPVPQIMKFNGSKYINNTMSLVRGPINFTVTVNDTGGNTFTSTPHMGIAPDHAPTASNVAITPPYPYTTDNLVASWSYSDQDGDPQNNNWSIQWYNNSVLESAYTNLTTVPASATTKGEIWYFTLQVYDGFKYSNVYTSPNVIINNSPPVITMLTILPAGAKTTDNLIAYYIYFDADNDPQLNASRRIYWYKNGALQPTLNNSLIVGAGNTTKSQFWYFTIQVYDGTTYSSVYTAAAIQILNTAPTASNVIISPTNPHINNSLTALWNYSDVNGDSQSANWILHWYKNGVHQTSYDNKTTIPAFAFVKGDVWNYTLRVFDGTDYSIQYNSTSVTILDTAPTASNVIITPTNPDRTNNLVVSYTYSDLDGDPQNSNVKIWWYLNGNHNSTYDNFTVLPSSALARGQTWYYTIRVYDGQLYSILTYMSSYVTIVNSPPVVSSPTFNSTTVTSGNTVNVTYTYSDPDNDPQKGFSIFWYNNSVYVPKFFNFTKILFNSSNVGNIWYYIIKVYDGYNYSLNYTSVYIGIGVSNPANTLPTALNLTITSNPFTTDPIVGSYKFSDPDGDQELGTQIRWYKNDVLQPSFNNTLTIPASATTKGDHWYFSVLPKDSRGGVGNWTNSSITIVINSPPTASNLVITPNNPYTTDNLIASWSYSDANNDPQNSSWIIYWYINGILNTTFNNNITISSIYTRKGEIWYFSLRVYDGTNYSILLYNSSSVTILNTPPVASQIIITPTNPHTNNSLVANWTYFDADNDPQNLSWIIRWYINGLLNTTFNNNKTISSIYTRRGEVWYYTLQVYDGQNYSIIYTSSAVQILDTAPTASNIQITPVSPIHGDSLTVSYNWLDIDPGDFQAGTQIRWYKNGVLQSNLNDLTNIPGSLIIKGDVWNVTVRVSDGTLYGALIFIVVKIGNTPPTVTVNVSPGAPVYTNDTLSALYQYSDVDNDPMVAISIQWYMTNATGSFLISSLINKTQVPSSMTAKNETWYVSIRVFDGENWSVIINSTVITIINSPPTLLNIAFSGGYLGTYNTTSNITLAYQYFDADNDPMVAISIIWYMNNLNGSGYLIISSLNNLTHLPSNMTTKNEEWYVLLRVFDGENWSIFIKSTIITIINSPPIAKNYVLLGGYNTSSNIILFYLYSDADNDPQQNTSRIIYWYRNGLVVGALTNSTYVPSSYTARNQNWYAVFQIYDGSTYSKVYTTPAITIGDSAPVLTVATINNNATTTYVAIGLTVSYNYTDLDNDTIPSNDIIVYWYVNGIYQPGLQNFLFISMIYLTKGETWQYIIQISDGQLWSQNKTSSPITIINTPPVVSNLQFTYTQYSQFILETENITISYSFHDNDVGDTNHSYIKWYMNGTYLPAFDNLTFIPSADLLPGEIWYFIVIPSDGYNNGTAVQSASITIESVPHINNYGVEIINDTEGHYIFWFNVTANPIHPANANNINPTISFELIINNSIYITITPLLANYNGTLYVYEYQLSNYTLFGSLLTISIDATSTVKYAGIYSLITSSANFSFVLRDTVPPRVESVTYIFNNQSHPTNVTFYVQIIDYGSGVANATLYYYFEPASNNLSTSEITNWVYMKDLYYVSSNQFQAIVLQRINSTYFFATVSFNNTMNTIVLFRIAVEDRAGNANSNAYPLGLDPNRPGAQWIAPAGGIPLEQVLGYLAVIIAIFAIFSFVIIKKFRKKELVGLDIDLVVEKAKKIKESEVIKSMDSHTLGIVISFFDQRHGPIPIMQEPEILRDNFEKLVELSDLSFSTGRFVNNFEEEYLLNFDFSVDERIRVSTVTYAFALDRPQARGGAENITFNILVVKDVYPLVSQFTNQFTDTIHHIHQIMNSSIQNKAELQKYLQNLRKTISAIVLAYIEIYGTTELIEAELLE